MKTIGVRLNRKQRRLLADRLSDRGAKREIGRRVGCAGQHLNQIVAGTKNPSYTLLARLCENLRLSLVVRINGK